MRIAIVGSGIAGLTAAYSLASAHEVTVFENDSRVGGHTHTVQTRNRSVDTGFIVFNQRTYPNFIRLLHKLGVSYRPAPMSFSVSDGHDFEFSGHNINSYFASRKLLVDPGHYRMLFDMARFNRAIKHLWRRGALSADARLGDILKDYSPRLAEAYALPMTAAIWSASAIQAADMPLTFFADFCCNHGLLDWVARPQWYVIEGGSSTYLEPLTRPLQGRIQTGAGVRRVVRGPRELTLHMDDGTATFDHVVMACHADQALALLDAPTAAEQAVLGAIGFNANKVQLHLDTQALPRRQRAWAAWNFRQSLAEPRLTYNMNVLQGHPGPEVFCVSLNWPGLAPEKVLGTYHYRHPQYTLASAAARARWEEINARSGISYCGAYWLNGFHEDGVVSAMRVVAALGCEVDF